MARFEPGVETLLIPEATDEHDGARLAADGYDNDAIAEALTLSVRTVERHLHNIYAKLEISGKSARAGAVAKLLTPA